MIYPRLARVVAGTSFVALFGCISLLSACARDATTDGEGAAGDDAGAASPGPDSAVGQRDATLDTGAPPDASLGDVAPTDAPVDAPIDAIALADASDAPIVAQDCVAAGGIVSLIKGNVRVDYDLGAGTATFFYAGVKKITSFYAGVQLASYVTSKMYTTRTCVVRGDETVVTNTGSGLPDMRQSFVLDGGNKFLATVTVDGTNLATNWIGPVVMDTAGGVDVGTYGDPRLLWVPFDNDAWVSYNALPMANSGTSYEVAAFYDNVSRNGIVVGSVTHDTWKTGVYYSGTAQKLNALNVFGGAVDKTWTHDSVAHGQVKGNRLTSPVVFVGYAPDWRDLMEEFADANAARQPKLAWAGGVPFGWNSWGKIQTQLNHDKAVAVSDFIHANLQNAGYANGGTVYVNLDSYWDNLTDPQLADFVAHCKTNGQKAGIYWAPFVDWGRSATRQVEGSGALYGDIWLKDGAGQPLDLDGAYAIDPSHPATKARIDTFIDRLKGLGFEYIKLDFLGHGALESSVRFDPNVQTGIQAYNQGMKYLLDRLAGTMFVSLSIAPLFPYQYGHARRVSCDAFGAATGQASTQYELNSASYGWWMNRRVYEFNDPDEMVFEGYPAGSNMLRLLSAVVSGTVFLNGDDLSEATGQALARAYLTNSRINDVARLGKAFRPVEGNTGTNPSDVLVLVNGAKSYVAVFNFGGSAVTRSVDLARAGLDGARAYTVTDLWSGATSAATGSLSVPLDAGFARLFALE